ncbi:methyltransferase domain-containing protein [Oryzomonas sagensis]|uniref:Methyltransferase domain-containing protein n=1 Tax=Oryzomonas sagensis TaxID=2603857 RepID=A0ABQ6TTE9_9BACT|nr:methyltransferase domain-containing protein [Oryzomonas sagensis]KAB0672326.1 methyltransferase domain-containing protein [Oryzomonas sagensis]
MDETSKTKSIWTTFEKSILTGHGIDIGCGPDPVSPNARKFDIEDGDANEILRFVNDQFDFVYSSHCLEHMNDPKKTLQDWWTLVKPGGHLFLIVPDEDLYEQGVFPSRFNPDHKATFTISKTKSWSPVSMNILDLALSLPQSQLVGITLHDHGYDRSIQYKGIDKPTLVTRLMMRGYRLLNRLTSIRLQSMDIVLSHFSPVDQTLRPGVLAQIQCIVRKQQ